MGCCRGGRYQGHKKTEKFLPVGAIVTVVGELARNTITTGPGMNLFRYYPVSNKALVGMWLRLGCGIGRFLAGAEFGLC